MMRKPMTMTTMQPTKRTLMTIDSPVGRLRLIGDGDALIGLSLPRQAAPEASEGRTPVLARAAEQLAEYFAGERRDFDVPLAASGTGFQPRVWGELAKIPYGETRSDGARARARGSPTASRAGGAAKGKNPISIRVPCQPVIAGSGALTGYAGGVDAKKWLLEHEARWGRPALFPRAS
jgi:methylated-DNA-[protein]-cysteine S-methyltransferase